MLIVDVRLIQKANFKSTETLIHTVHVSVSSSLRASASVVNVCYLSGTTTFVHVNDLVNFSCITTDYFLLIQAPFPTSLRL